jgi:hypothetical protein
LESKFSDNWTDKDLERRRRDDREDYNGMGGVKTLVR